MSRAGERWQSNVLLQLAVREQQRRAERFRQGVRGVAEAFSQAHSGAKRMAREMKKMEEALREMLALLLPPVVPVTWLRWAGFKPGPLLDTWVHPFFGPITVDEAHTGGGHWMGTGL